MLVTDLSRRRLRSVLQRVVSHPPGRIVSTAALARPGRTCARDPEPHTESRYATALRRTWTA